MYLIVRTDDEGAVEAFPAMILVGAGTEELDEIISKNFVVRLNDDDVVLIKDFFEQNMLRSDRTKVSRFRVVITYHCLQLRSCSRRRKYREYSPELIKEIRKFKHFTEMQSFCRKYRLDKPEQVENLITALRDRISDIAKDRDEDRRLQRHYERAGMPGYANYYRLSAQEKTKRMRPLYQEIHMCEDILKAEPGIRAMTLGLVKQRVDEESRRQARQYLAKTKNSRTRIR